MPALVTSKSRASRTRFAPTRRARYGTVPRPTATAISRANDAKTTVPITLPASRAAVEKIAAAKAAISPTAAPKKRTHAPEFSARKLFARCLNGANWVTADMVNFEVSTAPPCCQVTYRVERPKLLGFATIRIAVPQRRIPPDIPRKGDGLHPGSSRFGHWASVVSSTQPTPDRRLDLDLPKPTRSVYWPMSAVFFVARPCPPSSC